MNLLENHHMLATKYISSLVSTLELKLSDKEHFPEAEKDLDIFLDAIESFVNDPKLKPILQLECC